MSISKETFETLKIFYKKNSLTQEELSDIPEKHFNALLDAGFVTNEFLGYPDGRTAKYSDYHITDTGKAYVQEHSKSAWMKQNWLQILGVIFSCIAALPVIIQGIDYICKHIM